MTSKAPQAAERASLYEALDDLEAAALTADERATAAPLRQAMDAYIANADKLDELMRQDTAAAGRPPRR